MLKKTARASEKSRFAPCVPTCLSRRTCAFGQHSTMHTDMMWGMTSKVVQSPYQWVGPGAGRGGASRMRRRYEKTGKYETKHIIRTRIFKGDANV